MSFWDTFKQGIDITKTKIGSGPVPTLNNLKLPTKPKAMEFRVGEGLNEKQTNIAYEKIRTPDLVQQKKDNSFWGQFKKDIIQPALHPFRTISEGVEKASEIPSVKNALLEVAKRTSGTGILASIQASGPEKTFTEAYSALKEQQQNNPTKLNQFLVQLTDTLPQTAIGVALGFVPYAGPALSTSYWTAISAADQVENKGKVSSVGNLAIDVVGDRMLGNSLQALFKAPAKTLTKTVAQAFTTEGGTEVAQDLLKYANDYRNAKTEEEKINVLEESKKYFTSGQILMTAGVGGISGAGIGAGGYTIQQGKELYQSLTPGERQAGFAKIPGIGDNQNSFWGQFKPGGTPTQQTENKETKTTPKEIIKVNDKQFELTGESLAKYQKEKADYDKYTSNYKKTLESEITSASQKEYATKQLKAEGMKFSAIKREITGDLTPTEIFNKEKYEKSNYQGKKVEIEVNGEKVQGEIASPSAFGNFKVKLENGDIVSIKSANIKDLRTKQKISELILKRENAKLYSPTKAQQIEDAVARAKAGEDFGPRNQNIPKTLEPLKESGAIEEVGKLITDEKVRVVSREGKDVFQMKEGGQWVDITEKSPIQNIIQYDKKSTQLETRKSSQQQTPQNSPQLNNKKPTPQTPTQLRFSYENIVTPPKNASQANVINRAILKDIDISSTEKQKIKQKAQILNEYNDSIDDPLIDLPSTVKEKQNKLEGLMEVLAEMKDQVKNHPGKKLQRFVSKNEGIFEDFKNPDLVKTPSKKKAIKERNKRVMKVAEKALAGTPFSDEFDNPDTIREQIDEYQYLKQRVSELDEQRKKLEKDYFKETGDFYDEEEFNLEALRAFNDYDLGAEIEAAEEVKTNVPPAVYEEIESKAKNEAYKPMISAKQYGRDFFRNMEQFFQKGYDTVHENFITPFLESKKANAQMQREIINELDKEVVKKFGIQKDSKESRAVMDYGERNLQDEFAPETPETKESLVKKFGKEKAQNIIAADGWFRAKYNELIDRINEQRKRIYGAVWAKKANLDAEIQLIEDNISAQKIKMSRTKNKNTLQYLRYKRQLRRLFGLKQQRIDLTNSEAWWRGKIIPKRNDYYRHYQELADGFAALMNIITTEANIPTNFATISSQTKPKSKFLQFAQKRIGNRSKRDAVGGFLTYVPAATYAIHIDPHIEKFRKLADTLVKSENKRYSPFITYLTDFSDSLAGKTSALFDRDIQKVTGRKFIKVIDWINRRVKANTVLGNLRSSLVQISALPMGIASAKQHTAKGFTRLVSGIFNKNGPMQKSGFLNERYLDRIYDKFDHGMLHNTKKFTKWMLGALDEVGAKLIWNAHYEKYISEHKQAEGMTRETKEAYEARAIEYADQKTAKIVAGRGIGEVPLVYNSKTIQAIIPFQLEVGNAWWAMGDLLRERDIGAFMILFLLSHLLNKGYEEVTGSDVLFDPIQATLDAVKAFRKEENKGKGVYLAGGRLTGEVFSNIPFGQYLAALYPEFGIKAIGGITRKEFFGSEDPTRYGTGLISFKGITDPLYKILPPFGGGQIKKTKEGIELITQGESKNKGGEFQFKAPTSFLGKVQAVLLGKYVSGEARDFFAGETGQKELERLEKLSPEEANKILKGYKETNPSLFRKVKSLKEDKNLGITEEDKDIRSLGVENKKRAEYIFKETKKLKTPEEKNAYIKELRKKKIITDDVLKQLKAMAKENK